MYRYSSSYTADEQIQAKEYIFGFRIFIGFCSNYRNTEYQHRRILTLCAIVNILYDKELLIFVALFSLSCSSENEQGAISKTGSESVITLERAKYRLQYPSTWRVDSNEDGYDLDKRFSLYPPYENAVCMFFLLDAVLDEEKFMNDQVNAQLETTIKNGKVTYFERWGSLKGHGANITGRFFGIFKGKFSVFCRSTDSSTFMVVHQYPDRIENSILPELQKIKSAFKLKK